MNCPSCGNEGCVRSHRRGTVDWLVTVAALRPWRCLKCKRRFYGRAATLTSVRHAHCPRCGNLKLQHIGKRQVAEGRLRWFFQALNATAYRCDPCRFRFFSFRPIDEMRPAKKPSAIRESASQ
ncbi:MAG: hypothetical protein ACYDCD_05765 [Candidatus Acidiferrales bacterium]